MDEDDSSELLWAAAAAAAASVVLVSALAKTKRPPARSTELRGHNIVVTGANSGIGLACVKELHRKGATVIATVRDAGAAQSQVFKDLLNEDFRIVQLDLDDVNSIAAAARIIQQGPPVSSLINNAGAMNPEYDTKNGIERTLMSNWLGPFSLTNKLLAHMKGIDGASPRVVNVGSKLAKNSDIGTVVDSNRDLRGHRGDEEGNKYSMWKAYANSKYIQMLCTNFLAGKEDSGIVYSTVTPGVCNTRLNRWANPVLLALSWPLRAAVLNSPEKGASGVIFAATSAEATKSGAVYDSNSSSPSGTFGEWQVSKPMDAKLSKDVYEMSMALLKEVEKGS